MNYRLKELVEPKWEHPQPSGNVDEAKFEGGWNPNDWVWAFRFHLEAWKPPEGKTSSSDRVKVSGKIGITIPLWPIHMMFYMGFDQPLSFLLNERGAGSETKTNLFSQFTMKMDIYDESNEYKYLLFDDEFHVSGEGTWDLPLRYSRVLTLRAREWIMPYEFEALVSITGDQDDRYASARADAKYGKIFMKEV